MDSTDRLDELITYHPYLEGIFVDMARYLDSPAEVIDMFSEALKILDENTVHYMIEEMKKQIDEDKKAMAEKDDALAEKDSALARKDAMLNKNKAELEDAKAEIERLKKQLQTK